MLKEVSVTLSGTEIILVILVLTCTLTKIFYIGGLVSFIGLVVMILTGLTSIGDILSWKFNLCPWCM
jgi:hypothetical protein